MLTSLPFTAQSQTPNPVRDYLRNNKWTQTPLPSNSSVEYWTSSIEGSIPFGYFTWEQALAYTMFSKLHLGLS